MDTLVTYHSAQGFFIAPLEAVANSKQGNITAAALEQRVSTFYATQEAAERACHALAALDSGTQMNGENDGYY